MFKKNSDYALNKINPDAIVCASVSGVNVELTREQFDNEEEFMFWKQLSDDDYKVTEENGRGYDDHTVSLIEGLDAGGPSVEDVLIALMEQYERGKQCREQVVLIRSVLTEKQFRRLWLHYAEGKTHQEIAEVEHVTQQAAALSISKAKKKIFRFSHFLGKTPCKKA